ncbi:MAG: NAD-dependent epimerase/dehydratase family protein [Chloroflexi bacterium]|nr:NAD-dependent epimerase/dehydratase family protein [Chloroflexota bacterium]
MKVLVTGGSGFIGSHLVDKLVERGHQVRVLDVKHPHRGDVDFVMGSTLSLREAEAATRGMEAVYHLAGFSNIDLVKDNPVATVRSILGTGYALEAARRCGVGRLLFASSIFVYEQRGHLYTTTKVAGERMCKDYQTLYGLPYTILRLGTAYGPRSRDADVVSIFVRVALRGGPLVVHGSGRQRRNFLYVEDMAEGCCAALAPQAENKSYDIVGRESVAIGALAETVACLFGNRVVVSFDSFREDDHVGHEHAPDEGSWADLAWEPRTSLEDGVRKYIAWSLEHRSLVEGK